MIQGRNEGCLIAVRGRKADMQGRTALKEGFFTGPQLVWYEWNGGQGGKYRAAFLGYTVQYVMTVK